MRTSVQELLESAHSLNVPIVAGAAHLFRAMLLEEVDEEGQHKFQEARAVAMRKFLADRVRDPSLGIEQLMGAFGASRATIFRDFEPYGGVSHFVAEERVKGVALDLMKRTPDRGAVLRVSEEWGFSSPHMFSRFFRKHLGMAPSEVLGLRRGEF